MVIRRSDPKVDRLGSLALFHGCSRRELERLAGAAELVTMKAGSAVIRQGGVAHEVFVMADGEVTVSRDGAPLATLSAGDHFGEVGVLAPRTSRRDRHGPDGRRTLRLRAATVPGPAGADTHRQPGSLRRDRPSTARRRHRLAAQRGRVRLGSAPSLRPATIRRFWTLGGRREIRGGAEGVAAASREETEGIVTVLFTDVEGSTVLHAARNDSEARTVFRACVELARRQVEQHSGR